jgi:hypothetical protein
MSHKVDKNLHSTDPYHFSIEDTEPRTLRFRGGPTRLTIRSLIQRASYSLEYLRLKMEKSIWLFAWKASIGVPAPLRLTHSARGLNRDIRQADEAHH